MFREIRIKRVLERGGRLENAMKTLKAKNCFKSSYWPFRDIYKLRNKVQFINYDNKYESIY